MQISTPLIRDAFGPQLNNDNLSTLPGTPLPSLVQDSPEHEFTELQPPPTPVEKDEVISYHYIRYKNFFFKHRIIFQILDPDSLYFRDGRRKIDMILVYEEEELGVMTEAEARRRDQRKIFQVDNNNIFLFSFFFNGNFFRRRI